MIVYLVGMPGAGKSVVGKELAGRLGVPFVDLDTEIERPAGKPVSEIFAEVGEAGFRAMEAAALTGASAQDPGVVACGGGVVLEPANRITLRNTGIAVFLDVPLAQLQARVRPAADRPLIRSQGDMERLLAEREPLYREFAAHVVEGSGTPARGRGGHRRGAALVRVTVEVPGHPYDVVVGSGVLAHAGEHLPDLPGARRAFVLADANVAGRYYEPLAAGLGAGGLEAVLLTVPPGEGAKTLAVYETLLHQLATQEAHRDDPVVALGGGATGDLAGFVASTYMRGVPFVQVPTTLTAQVDAAIGGKTAVNLPEGKNLVGTFAQPRAVLADVDALATLSDRDYRSGLAEVAKYALTLDLDLLAQLESDPGPVLARDADALESLVARCAAAKAATVARDERDTGARLILNYGHTLGHALERLDGFAGRSHGEAIAMGMMFAARLSELRGLAEPGLSGRTARLLRSLGLEPEGPLPAAAETIDTFRLDKKFREGARFVLLQDVGKPVVVENIPESQLLRGPR